MIFDGLEVVFHFISRIATERWPSAAARDQHSTDGEHIT
jgi:hypothetical protein